MKDTEIKEMLSGIINNGEKWECKPNYKCDPDGCGVCRYEGYCDWRPYKLGDEIHNGWEYRKVETWYVCIGGNGSYSITKFKPKEDTVFKEVYFEGSKTDCEKWIKEHTNKNWLEEYIDDNTTLEDRAMAYMTSKEVCKKILEEIKSRYYAEKDTIGILEEIIKDLGIKV